MVGQVVAYLDEWFDGVDAAAAYGVDPAPGDLAEFRRPPGEEGKPLEGVLRVLTEAGRGGIHHPSGGHMSYIPNSGMYTAALGSFLAAGLNRFTGVAVAAPGFTAIEYGVVDWLTALFELGDGAAGLLLSGGSMANFTGIVAARVARLDEDFSDGVVYVSTHTHHSVAKASRLAGFREDQIRVVPVDDEFRIDTEGLAEAVSQDRAAGKRPALVVASAGSTDTGTVDPLESIADFTESEGLWLHVDGAYGGFFKLTDRGSSALSGIKRADSIALDPHKGLSIPFGVGALLAKDEDRLREAYQGRGAYLRDDDTFLGQRDIASLGPELTRPFRALSVWLPLQVHGIAPFREFLNQNLDVAEHAYRRVKDIDGIRANWEPDLSIVAFGFDDDGLGRAAWEAVNADGAVHLSPTIINDRFILRFAILNRRSTVDHVDHAIDIIEKTLIG